MATIVGHPGSSHGVSRALMLCMSVGLTPRSEPFTGPDVRRHRVVANDRTPPLPMDQTPDWRGFMTCCWAAASDRFWLRLWSLPRQDVIDGAI